MSLKLYNRLISYLRYLKQLPDDEQDTVSSTMIASALNINDVQVRKDLAFVSDGGRPKTGHNTKALIADLEHFLGHDNYTDAVLVGTGRLGQALLSYGNFRQYGLQIIAAFDTNPALVGTKIGETQILDAVKVQSLCMRMGINIGIVAVPAEYAQTACDALTAGGVQAIWNFAPVNLQVPEGTVLKNEDMATSLAMLTRQLRENSEVWQRAHKRVHI
jgi:redox-sensing transcriptional repressor